MHKTGKYIALLLALLLTIPCLAATPTVVQHILGANGAGENAGMSAINSSYPYIMGFTNPTNGSNTLVAIMAGCPTGGSLAALTVSDPNGDSFSQIASLYDSTNCEELVAYCASAIAAGSTSLTWYPTTASITMQFPQLVIFELQNASCTTRGTNATGNGSGSSMSTGSFSANAGDFVYGAFGKSLYDGLSFSSFSYGSGFNPWPVDLEFGLGDEYEMPSSSGSVNPSATEGSSDGVWDALGFALESSSSGSGPQSFSIIDLFHANYYSASTAYTSNVFQFPVYGSVVVMAVDNPTAVSSVTDNNGVTWTQIGANCPKGSFTDFGAMWFRTVASPPLTNEKITLSYASNAPNLVAFIYDIQGANTSSPYDTTIGTNGLACESGDQTGTYSTPITFFTITPSASNEITIFHSNEDYNDSIGTPSPSSALFLTSIMDSGASANGFTYQFDEASGNGLCLSCSGSQTWEVNFDDAHGSPMGYYEGFAVAIKPASSILPPTGLRAIPF